MKINLKFISFNFLIIVFIFALLEILISYAFNNPRLIKCLPMPFKNNLRNVYGMSRNILQGNPACVRYDNLLGYTFRPGRFTFSNIEFANDFYVNTLGVRDDEKSLVQPRVIVLGDSYATGWGVEQDETFAQVLEKKSGLTVLNAAIPSYGTVREMRILRHFDLSNLKYLIIHYNSGDYLENRAFYLNKNKLYIMSLAKFKQTQKEYNQAKKYYFEKYSIFLLKDIFVRLGVKIADIFKNPEPVEKEVDFFINAITEGSIDLNKVQLIVLCIYCKKGFAPILMKKISFSEHPKFIKNMIVLDIDPIINEEDRFLLDEHLTRKGHEKIADALLKIIHFKDENIVSNYRW